MTPDILHSDNGLQFRNKLVNAMAKSEKFQHLTGSSETPQHQGQIERANRTIKQNLFKWLGENPDIAAGKWHSDGLKSVVANYNGTVHSTIHMPSDVYYRSRLSNPKQRDEHKAMIDSLNRLLHDRTGRFPATSGELQAAQDGMTAAYITSFLERRDHIFRHALTWTSKTQAANRIRRTGIRLTETVVPKVGQKVTFKRPSSKKFKSKNPTLMPNVEAWWWPAAARPVRSKCPGRTRKA